MKGGWGRPFGAKAVPRPGLHAVGMFIADLFKSRCRLEAENLFLRHRLNIALRRAPPRREHTYRCSRMRPWVERSRWQYPSGCLHL
jgi:hypothetical protein